MEHFIVKKLCTTSSSSSSDSDSNDDAMQEIVMAALHKKRRSRVKNEKYMEVALKYDLDDFKSHFRLSKSTVEKFLSDNNFRPLSISKGRPSIPILDCMLLTLWLLANEESFRSVGDRFSFSKGHSHTIFLKMCKLISSKANKYIRWPRGNEATKNLNDFNNLRGERSFPNVFGCIDGSHIAIPGPTADNSYYNRKGFHSIQMQCICNARQEFIDVFCGWPGSVHDSRVWLNSPIYNKLLTNTDEMLPNNSYLLGDSAYPLNTFLMVPFRDNGHLTAQQKLFNWRLSSTRVTIEQSFGRLKGMFRRLRYLHILNLSYVKYIVFSACILHNVVLQNHEQDIDENVDITDDDNVEPEIMSVNNMAATIRENIMRSLK